MGARLFSWFILLSVVSLGFPARLRRATTECCTAVASSDSTIVQMVLALLGVVIDDPVDVGVGCSVVPVGGNCVVGEKVSCDTPLDVGAVSICLPSSAVLNQSCNIQVDTDDAHFLGYVASKFDRGRYGPLASSPTGALTVFFQLSGTPGQLSIQASNTPAAPNTGKIYPFVGAGILQQIISCLDPLATLTLREPRESLEAQLRRPVVTRGPTRAGMSPLHTQAHCKMGDLSITGDVAALTEAFPGCIEVFDFDGRGKSATSPEYYRSFICDLPYRLRLAPPFLPPVRSSSSGYMHTGARHILYHLPTRRARPEMTDHRCKVQGWHNTRRSTASTAFGRRNTPRLSSQSDNINSDPQKRQKLGDTTVTTQLHAGAPPFTQRNQKEAVDLAGHIRACYGSAGQFVPPEFYPIGFRVYAHAQAAMKGKNARIRTSPQGKFNTSCLCLMQEKSSLVDSDNGPTFPTLDPWVKNSWPNELVVLAHWPDTATNGTPVPVPVPTSYSRVTSLEKICLYIFPTPFSPPWWAIGTVNRIFL
ncbi:hypothetical protein B0H14DRAFT_2645709 [Mycena olivaceomarginata]|nr:hypothetical protein B0H14DRAFT_2645709 [Mycena olivaceomarginata]